MARPASTKTNREIYSVSRLTRTVGALLESNFPLLWVEGELSNLAQPSSGHWYFSLKDAQSQVRCAMFRGKNKSIRFQPEAGTQVLVQARVGLYEARGDFQLIVERMEPAGDGALQLAFEQLKKRLDGEGLFSPDHKQDIPLVPHGIGVVTSPTGAAIRDVISVLKRRFPALTITIYPVPVQGEGAAQQIAAAIKTANQRKECDILILARGGGSLEDLWAFNEEPVARAIYKSKIPIVSGIGHEIDFTIADFVADQRAPTPSVAAEIASPDQLEWLTELRGYQEDLQSAMAEMLTNGQQRLEWVGKRLQQQHPGTRLRQQAQKIDDIETRLRISLRTKLRETASGLSALRASLLGQSPLQRLQLLQNSCEHISMRMNMAVQHSLEERNKLLASTVRALDAISPLATLGRGYAIVRDTASGEVVRDYRDAPAGTEVSARLARGTLVCTVDTSKEGKP